MYFIVINKTDSILKDDLEWIGMSVFQSHPEEFSKVFRTDSAVEARNVANKVQSKICHAAVVTGKTLEKKLRKKNLSLGSLCVYPRESEPSSNTQVATFSDYDFYFVLRNNPNPTEVYSSTGTWINFRDIAENRALLHKIGVFYVQSDANKVRDKFVFSNSKPFVVKRATLIKYLQKNKVDVSGCGKYPYNSIDEIYPSSEIEKEVNPLMEDVKFDEAVTGVSEEDWPPEISDMQEEVGVKRPYIIEKSDVNISELETALFNSVTTLLEIKGSLAKMLSEKRQQIAKCEEERQDLFHLCEFYELDSESSCRFTSALHEISQKRRVLKDEIEVLMAAQNLLDCISKRSLQDVVNAYNSRFGRRYVSRRLGEKEIQHILEPHL